MKLTEDILKKMIRTIWSTKAKEVGCDDCFEQLDRFAEMKLAGKNPEQALPLVQDHLNRCKSCREEYEALLEGLKQLEASEPG